MAWNKLLAFVNVNSKNFGSILVSFEFRKFQSHNMKAMAKDKKDNIAVTYYEETKANRTKPWLSFQL
jgi:hypothetical protein